MRRAEKQQKTQQAQLKEAVKAAAVNDFHFDFPFLSSVGKMLFGIL